MSSTRKTESRIDLEHDLPTTAEDVEALRRVRHPPMTAEQYLAFLRQFPSPSFEDLRHRRGPHGEPFEL